MKLRRSCTSAWNKLMLKTILILELLEDSMKDLDRFCQVDCTLYLMPGGDSNENLRQVCNSVEGNFGCDSDVRNSLKFEWLSWLISCDSILARCDMPRWMFFKNSQLPFFIQASSFSIAVYDWPPPSATYSKVAPNFCAASWISEDGSEPALVISKIGLFEVLDLTMRSKDMFDGWMLLTLRKSPTKRETALVNKSGLIHLIMMILDFHAIFSLPSGTS